MRLFRSTDGGASWTRLAARGWSGTQLVLARGGDEDVLISPGTAGIEVSMDGGLSFETLRAPTGHVDARPLGGGRVAALASGETGQHLLTVPGGGVRAVPGTALENAQLVFHPDWPEVPPGQPSAFASGTDSSTGLPVLQKCDEGFLCSKAAVVDAQPGVAVPFVSPGFANDATIFAAHQRGGLFRSDDGGATFRPVTVVPPDPRRLIWTVPAMAFSRDFDAAAPRGSAYLGLISLSGKPGGSGRLAGGVYRSSDGGRTWRKVGGASDLDRGVTALAVAGDRVLAAPLGAFDRPAAPILCSTGLRSWRTACPVAGPPDEAAASFPAQGGKTSRGRPAGPTDTRGEGHRSREDRRHLDRAGRAAPPDGGSATSIAAVLGGLTALGVALACVRVLRRR
ncbi:MAG: WD40/YVTN/BNR-like repeat-containing protein [Actinomycetota bacterium]